MTSDRLTAETARVGMRVRCVDDDLAGRLTACAIYTVIDAPGYDDTVRLLETGDCWFCASRFIPADPTPSLRAILSDRAPDLLAALVEWHGVRQPAGSARALFDGIQQLYDAIERAGLLTEPSQTAPLPAMFCGADAFTQEDSDAG